MGVTRATLKNVLQKNGHKVVGSAATAETAWVEILELKPDVAILDLNLKGNKNGLWLAQKLRKQLSIAIIFLTAYGSNEILEKIADVQAEGYIMKPFNNPTLLGTVKLAFNNRLKYLESLNNRDGSIYTYKNRSGIYTVNFNELLYLKSEGNYVELVLDDKVLTLRIKLDGLMQEINCPSLIKVHRRYAIHVSKVSSIEDTHAVLLNKEQIPIAKTYRAFLKSKFLDKDY